MDPLSHLALTRLVIGPDRAALLTALVPDLPFYSCYPVWVARHGLVASALRSGAWPQPPAWLLRLHRATHSTIPALFLLIVSGLLHRDVFWRVAMSWLLHILVDLPTHRREPWGPRPLWPFSELAVEGVGWADVLSLKLASWL